MAELTTKLLKVEAELFADTESGHGEAALFGVTDGKLSERTSSTSFATI